MTGSIARPALHSICAAAVAVLCVVGGLAIWFTVETQTVEAKRLSGPMLGAYRKWADDGKPTFDVRRYIATSTDEYMLHTNIYWVQGVPYESLMAGRSIRCPKVGLVVMSRDGAVIWLKDDSPPSVLVPLQTNAPRQPRGER